MLFLPLRAGSRQNNFLLAVVSISGSQTEISPQYRLLPQPTVKRLTTSSVLCVCNGGFY